MNEVRDHNNVVYVKVQVTTKEHAPYDHSNIQ